MDEETYQQIPETLVLREIRFSIVEPGPSYQIDRDHHDTYRCRMITARKTSQSSMAFVGIQSWISGVSKSNLNLGHVRCKSPEMVRSEMWTTMLAYNLIRTTAAGAALLHGKQPRQISFTSTCQYVLASWDALCLPEA